MGNGRSRLQYLGMLEQGQCLEELCGLLRHQGFKILAAANFVGEHSFAHDEVPLAIGRPDDNDLEIAADFGKKIAEKINSGLMEITLEGKALEIGENYTRTRENWPENGVRKIACVSEVDEDRCIRCQECVGSCPMGAIDGNTLIVDDESCIRCFACVRVCLTGVRKILLTSEIFVYFKSLISTRKEPHIIL